MKHKNINKTLATDLLEEFEDCFEGKRFDLSEALRTNDPIPKILVTLMSFIPLLTVFSSEPRLALLSLLLIPVVMYGWIHDERDWYKKE